MKNSSLFGFLCVFLFIKLPVVFIKSRRVPPILIELSIRKSCDLSKDVENVLKYEPKHHNLKNCEWENYIQHCLKPIRLFVFFDIRN